MANPVGFENSRDPKRAAANARARIEGKGDELFQQDQDVIAGEDPRRLRYEDLARTYYDPMARGEGGYSAEERAQIMGDPDSYDRYFDPEGMNQALETQQGRQGAAVDALDENLRTSIDQGRLRQSEAYRQDVGNQLNRNEGGFYDIHGDTAGNVRGAIDPGAVTTSDRFLEDYNMSPEEKQDIITGAGISAGTGYRAAVGTAERQARAAGANPLGVAAYRARMEREGAAAAGDAMTQARIRASEAEANRMLTGEQLRTQGGRYLTDVETGTEMALGQEALRGWENVGQQALAQKNFQEQNRQGTEEFVTQAQMDAAKTAGQARLQNAQTETQQGQQQRQYAATTGTGLATGADEARSRRAGQVADTRLGEKGEGLKYYERQGTQANENVQAGRGRQQQTYSTQTGGGNQAVSNQVQADRKPALWERVAGVATGAVSAAKPKGFADGGVVTEPTVGIIAENGPEMVLPLTYRSTARARPSMAMPQRRRQFYGEAA